MDKDKLVEIGECVVAAYLRDGLTVAKLCDEHLDRSGAMLGYVRAAALRSHAQPK